MDFGSCSEAGFVASVDSFASIDECKCKFSNCLLVVFAEFVKFFIELGNFGVNVVGYIL